MASSSASQAEPLRGIRVLSFGAFVAGNICALMLAELGADVVKIESRDRPEALRAYDVPGRPQVVEPSGIRTTALFAGMTRGLRSACLDMADEAGRRTFRELSARADVVLENLGPGTMESWGCSYADLRAHNPELVMLAVSGYGRSGPLADFRAYASNINNFLGHTLAWAPDGIHFDFVAGIHGACAIVAALAEVARGAPGVYIDMAQTEAGAAILPALYLDYLANGREWSAGPNEVPGSLFSGVFRCRGADAWVAVELEDARDWAILCSFLERPDLRPDAGGVDARPPGGRGLGRHGHASPGGARAARAGPGGWSRAGQRGPVAGSAAPQPGCPRRGLPPRPRVSRVSGRPLPDTPGPGAPADRRAQAGGAHGRRVGRMVGLQRGGRRHVAIQRCRLGGPETGDPPSC